MIYFGAFFGQSQERHVDNKVGQIIGLYLKLAILYQPWSRKQVMRNYSDIGIYFTDLSYSLFYK